MFSNKEVVVAIRQCHVGY